MGLRTVAVSCLYTPHLLLSFPPPEVLLSFLALKSNLCYFTSRSKDRQPAALLHPRKLNAGAVLNEPMLTKCLPNVLTILNFSTRTPT